jgi:hypothetical protein
MCCQLMLLTSVLLLPLLQSVLLFAVSRRCGGQHCCLQCSAVHPHGCASPDLHWVTFFAEVYTEIWLYIMYCVWWGWVVSVGLLRLS